MSLSVAEVAKVALLARLRVEPGELETFTGQLNSIVDYVAQLQELDTDRRRAAWPMVSKCATCSATTYAGRHSIVKKRSRMPPSGTRRAFWFPPFWNDRMDSRPRNGMLALRLAAGRAR